MMQVQVADDVNERSLCERIETEADSNDTIPANPLVLEKDENGIPPVQQAKHRFCPCCCLHCESLDGNPEAIAWAIDKVATSILKQVVAPFWLPL